jgi:L-ascorbate metabolism protein UlaG (beta-lactamase superfamily)
MKLTWYGHSAFRVEVGDARILIDPFLSGNTTWAGGWEGPAEGCTHVLLTHGHSDHLGDAAAICKKTGAQLVANFEVCSFLAGQGVENANPGNIGGTVDCGGFTTSFVVAHHSASVQLDDGQIVYLGNPMGLIVKAPGASTLYHMGDTEIFGDMALINEIHKPEIGIVPIGDRFTMGAKTAAMACQRFFKFRRVIPCHYGTFPIIDPDAEKFKGEMGGDAGKVLVPERGKAVAI